MSTRETEQVAFEDQVFDFSKKDPLENNPVHPNLRTLSYSGLLTFHSCPRKFELQRLLPRKTLDDNDEKGHLAFGTVVGNGVQEFLVSGSIKKAIFRAFLDWKDYLDSEKGEKVKKTFWHALIAIQKFQQIKNEELSQYEVTSFNGRPAVELGYEIDLGDGFKTRGFMDALLRHKISGKYLVLECKTTGNKNIDAASYANSSQAVGYGIVVDAVVASELRAPGSERSSNSYEVFYPVYKTFSQEWEPFLFTKTNTQRTLWIQDLLLDIEHIKQYVRIGYFPMRGESCYSYGRSCDFFGICSMSNERLIPSLDAVEVKVDAEDAFPLKFSLEDIIEGQVSKIENGEVE